MTGSSGFDFSIGPFPVRVHWSFFLITVLIGLDMRNPILTVSWVLIVFVSILVHELGHAAVAESYGMVPSIMLYSMGGMTIPLHSKRLTHFQEIVLSLAGPFAGLALGGLVYLGSLFLPSVSGVVLSIVSQLLWVNVGWGILNLIPMLPLDGGHVMRSLWQWLRRTYDERLPLKISIGVGIAVAVAALMLGQIFGALLAVWFTYNNFTTLRGGRTIIY